MNHAVRIGAIIAAGILFFVFLFLVLSGADKSAYITVATVLVFSVVATRIDDVTNLKFTATGVAAQLEQQLREAQATVAQLQTTAEIFAEISILQIASSNRLGGLTPTAKREAVTMIEGGLKAIELPSDRVAKALAVQRPFDDFDYCQWTMYPITHSYDSKAIEERNEFKKQFPDKGIGNNPSPENVEAFLQKNGWHKGEIAERLIDWKQYREKGTHRRLEQWEARYQEKIGSLDDVIKGDSGG